MMYERCQRPLARFLEGDTESNKEDTHSTEKMEGLFFRKKGREKGSFCTPCFEDNIGISLNDCIQIETLTSFSLSTYNKRQIDKPEQNGRCERVFLHYHEPKFCFGGRDGI